MRQLLKGKIMKNKLGVLLALVLSLCMTIGVWADAGTPQNVDYKTDYYMIVESREGGVDIYSEPRFDSSKLNDERIPNGTAIHVVGERKTDDGKIWAYGQYQGMYGFVPMDDLKPATLTEAIQSEYSLFNGKDVEYDIDVNAEEGSVSLYKGPGKKYGTVSGAADIANGQKLAVTSEVDTGKGGVWGETTYNGISGWVNVTEAAGKESSTVEMVADTEQLVDTVETSTQEGTAGNTGKAVATATPKPTATPTVKPTATPTPKPTATPTTKPTATPTSAATPTSEPTTAAMPTAEPAKEPTAAPTEEPVAEPTEAPTATPTAEPTKEPTATPTEEITPTEEATPTAEATTPTGEAEEKEAASTEVESASWVQNPVIWILIVLVLIALGIVFYLVKKKNQKN